MILRKHFNHVKQSVWHDTLPKIMDVAFPNLREKCRWDKSDWFITFPNGSEIWIGGLDDKERTEKILGKEYSTLYFNECSEISYESRNIALTRLAEKNSLTKRVFYDCNPPKKSHWTYRCFVDNRDPNTEESLNSGDFASLLMNPYDNAANIDHDYVTGVLEKLPPALRDRFLKGEFGYDDSDIFAPQWLMPSETLPSKDDIAAVFGFCDPAITEKERSNDNTCDSGIVVMALDYSGILHDIEVLKGMWSYKDLKDKCKSVWDRYKDFKECFFGVEDVAFQKALGSDLEEMGVSVDYIRPDADKTRRAISITDILENGLVRVNSLALRKQLLEFPGDKKKDLVDAFVYALKLYKFYKNPHYKKEEEAYKDLDQGSRRFWKTYMDDVKSDKPKGGAADFYINLFK